MTDTFTMESREKLDQMARLDYDVDVMLKFKGSDAYRILYRRIYAQTQDNMTRILDKRRSNPHTLVQLAAEAAAYNEILRFIDEPATMKKAIMADQKFNEEAHNAQELIAGHGDMYDELDDGIVYGGVGATL